MQIKYIEKIKLASIKSWKQNGAGEGEDETFLSAHKMEFICKTNNE